MPDPSGRRTQDSRVTALRARLKQSEWIVCAEALRILDGEHRAVVHVCPHCGKFFDSPSVCVSSGRETEPREIRVTAEQAKRLSLGSLARMDSEGRDR